MAGKKKYRENCQKWARVATTESGTMRRGQRKRGARRGCIRGDTPMYTVLRCSDCLPVNLLSACCTIVVIGKINKPKRPKEGQRRHQPRKSNCAHEGSLAASWGNAEKATRRHNTRRVATVPAACGFSDRSWRKMSAAFRMRCSAAPDTTAMQARRRL